MDDHFTYICICAGVEEGVDVHELLLFHFHLTASHFLQGGLSGVVFYGWAGHDVLATRPKNILLLLIV